MLRLEGITYIVGEGENEKKILDGITLELDERFVAFTGPNGGGKSTLAKVIAGIITPTSGKIYLDGEDITSLSVTERAQKGISYAFQQPVRFKGITVRDPTASAGHWRSYRSGWQDPGWHRNGT